MQAHESGAHFCVTIDACDIADFAERWRNWDIPRAPVTITFDKRTGDLVDISSNAWRDSCEDETAFAEDALAFAIKALKIESLYWRAGMAHDSRESIYA